MLTLKQIGDALELEVLAGAGELDRTVEGGYASDLLSCVMSHAKAGQVWVTLQAHINVVAVAGLLGLAGVIVTEGQRPDEGTIERAEHERVVLLATAKSTFMVVGELTALGVRGEPARV